MPPKAGTVPTAGVLVVSLREGGLPGIGVRELVDRFDYVPFRARGSQRHLEFAKVDGEYRLALPVGTRRGSFLVGFTTEPRFVRVERASGRYTNVLVQHHAKLALRVHRGAFEPVEASPAVAARFGWRLEIVPLTDPLTLGVGDLLIARVRFGNGLAGCEVVAERLAPAGSEVAFRGLTGVHGHVEIPVRATGLWRLRARHEVPAIATRPAELHCATLVFRMGER